MGLIIEFWHQFFFEPLFNLLIWIYNNWANNNFGWAVVYLTLLLRFALLPLTVVNARNQAQNQGLEEEIEQIEQDFKDDPVLKKQKIRELLKEKKIRPWAKATSLAIQTLVLILLYEVFLQGVTGEKIAEFLYPSVRFPGEINNTFFGFDLSATGNWIWAGIVGAWLFVENYIDKKQSDQIEKNDVIFLIAFPGSVFVVLWWLPAVKALFIFTSILFSFIVGKLTQKIFTPSKN
jgi:YidC/Oxa1 family membrane protein insertase